MSLDPRKIQAALGEYTVRSTLHHNVEKIPHGVLLRGAYSTVAGGPGRKEAFSSQRAVDTLKQACQLLTEGGETGDVDIPRIAALVMLSEDQEYEDLQTHYEALVDTLPPPQQAQVRALTKAPNFGLSFSRIDWVSMARDEPDAARYLFVKACSKMDRLQDCNRSNDALS